VSKAGNIDERVAQHYAGLSETLQRAADYVVRNPLNVATRSLRSIAVASGISAPTYSRLARALGYSSYEELREQSREAIGRSVEPFSTRAERLQSRARSGDRQEHFFAQQSQACMANIDAQSKMIAPDALDAAVDALHAARRVLIVGGLGSAGIAEYFSYLASWFLDNWAVVGRTGFALGTSLARTSREDVVIILAKSPFATRSIRAADIAAERGATLIVITDSHACPALARADHRFLVPSESPQFFSSYSASLVLIESIIGMLLARSDTDAQARIRDVEAQNHRLEEFWTR
jgi:DNA-binding MurR/RpiR family transcriptional regulator